MVMSIMDSFADVEEKQGRKWICFVTVLSFDWEKAARVSW